MNETVKQKWVAALRSGKYKQGHYSLCALDGSMCCLGVLCELHREEHGGEWKEATIAGPQYLAHDVYLPRDVYEWAGLTTVNPQLGDHRADIWNDKMKASFEQIADLIEQHL